MFPVCEKRAQSQLSSYFILSVYSVDGSTLPLKGQHTLSRNSQYCIAIILVGFYLTFLPIYFFIIHSSCIERCIFKDSTHYAFLTIQLLGQKNNSECKEMREKLIQGLNVCEDRMPQRCGCSRMKRQGTLFYKDVLEEFV